MPPEVLAASPGADARERRWIGTDPGARLLVARVTARRCVRSAAMWGGLFGVVIVTSVSGYISAYPTSAGRAKLAASMGSNPGIAAILGTARRIDTVTGFTAWRSAGILVPVGSIWALLAATRLIRGEEESGRWEILLGGATTRAEAAAQALGAVLASLTVLWSVTAAATWFALSHDRAPVGLRSSLFFATALVLGPVVFACVGGLASQLGRTRRQAAQVAGACLGYSFLARALADSTAGAAWVRWTTPLGWIEDMDPLTGSRWTALIPAVVLVVALVALTVGVAGHRDLGTGAVPERDRRTPRTTLLGGPGAFSLRLLGPVGMSWTASLAVTGLMFGLVAPSAATALAASSSAQKMLGRLGATGVGPAAYLGLVFVVVASVVAFAAASQIASLQRDELSGHLEHLLVRAVPRRAWLTERALLGGLLLAVIGLAAAAAAWAGDASQGGGVGPMSMAAAAVEVTVPAVVVLGLGSLAYGISPRLAAPAAYGLVTWSFVLELLGSVLRINHWLLDTSILHHIRPAPAVPLDWASIGWLGLIAGTAAALGIVLFARRDIGTPE